MKSFHRRATRTAAVPAEKTGAANTALHRADQALVERGLAVSRTAAQRLIEAGRVSWHSRQGLVQVSKPSENLPPNAQLVVAADDDDRFVSRGGIKLNGALTKLQFDVTGLCCLDVGQSTGGFTDCLLQRGASSVVGLEVGHGQLHPRLQDDARVKLLEGVNARYADRVSLSGVMPESGFDLIVCDASFISLKLLLPQWADLLDETGHVLSLVKPQFEVGRGGVGKGGVVRDAALYREVEANIRAACGSASLDVLDYFESPITGSDGNREFFVFAGKQSERTLDE